MKLCYQFCIPHDEVLDEWFRASNDLYNQALYIFKQRLEKDNVWTWKQEMYHLVKDLPNLSGTVNYKRMKAHCSVAVLRLLDANIKSYCKSIKDWKKNPSKYKAMPQMPRYLKRGGMNSVVFDYQACSIKENGYILLTKDKKVVIPQFEKFGKWLVNFKQVRLRPLSDRVVVYIVYEKDADKKPLDKKKYASIDLGLDNLATMTTPTSVVIYNGRPIKSKNQYFNKRLAHFTSIKDKQGVKGTTKRIKRMYEKRDRQMYDAFHKVSRAIVDTLVEQKIGNLVVGYNVGWKQNTDMGRKTNQKSVQMPFARLRCCLQYKCELAGINYIEHEESYTSKCDALALEPIGKHEEYLGKRVKRGLFQSSVGKLVNADVNGAMNILRKVVGDSEFARIVDKGRMCRPLTFNIFLS